MGKSFRNIELFLVLFCQLYTKPFSVCLTVTSKINSYVKY